MRVVKKDDVQDTENNVYFPFNDVLLEYTKEEYNLSFSTAFDAAYETLKHELSSDYLMFYNTVHDATLAYITTDDSLNSPEAATHAIGIANTALHQHITTRLMKQDVLKNFNRLAVATDVSATLH